MWVSEGVTRVTAQAYSSFTVACCAGLPWLFLFGSAGQSLKASGEFPPVSRALHSSIPSTDSTPPFPLDSFPKQETASCCIKPQPSDGVHCTGVYPSNCQKLSDIHRPNERTKPGGSATWNVVGSAR